MISEVSVRLKFYLICQKCNKQYIGIDDGEWKLYPKNCDCGRPLIPEIKVDEIKEGGK